MHALDDARLNLIYDAAVEPALWRRVLEELMPSVGGEAATLSRMHINDGTGSAIIVNNDDDSFNKYFGYYYSINPIHLVTDSTSYLADWQPKIMLDDEWMPRDALESSEYYNDFLRPIHATWGMLIRLGLRGHHVVAVSIGRTRRGRFEDDEVAAIARLHPHLIRAYALSEQFTDLRALDLGLGGALDASDAAMILLDGEGRVLYVNAPGERLLRDGCVLTAAGGRLAPVGQRHTAAFATMLARAIGADGTPRAGGTLQLIVPGRKRPVAVSVSPLHTDCHWLFARAAAALVTVPSGEPQAAPTADTLAASYGSTPAETRLALALLGGMTLRDAAERQRISINTVRTQLASLFAKTGTHRQIDLLSLLAASGA